MKKVCVFLMIMLVFTQMAFGNPVARIVLKPVIRPLQTHIADMVMSSLIGRRTLGELAIGGTAASVLFPKLGIWEESRPSLFPKGRMQDSRHRSMRDQRYSIFMERQGKSLIIVRWIHSGWAKSSEALDSSKDDYGVSDDLKLELSLDVEGDTLTVQVSTKVRVFKTIYLPLAKKTIAIHTFKFFGQEFCIYYDMIKVHNSSAKQLRAHIGAMDIRGEMLQLQMKLTEGQFPFYQHFLYLTPLKSRSDQPLPLRISRPLNSHGKVYPF